MRAIDRIIDLLPLPALFLVGAIFSSGWLIKVLRGYDNYGPVFLDKYFQSTVILCIAGFVAYFLITRTSPFPINERGIVIAQFEGDATGSVQLQTLETLRSKLLDRDDLSDIRIVTLSAPISGGEEARKIFAERRATAIIGGSKISDRLVWYRIYQRNDLPSIHMSISEFPKIDEFTRRFFDSIAVQNTTKMDRTGEQFQRSKKFALIIGNSTYADGTGLLGVNDDIDRMFEAFTLQKANVSIVRNGTRLEILAALEKVFLDASTQNHPIIYFYYSGHGVVGGPAGIIPSDYSSPILLADIANRTVPNSGHLFVFADMSVGMLNDINSPHVSLLVAGQEGKFVPDVGGSFTTSLAKHLSEVNQPLEFDTLARAVVRDVQAIDGADAVPVAIFSAPAIVAASVR